MALARFSARNHPQQTQRNGARPEVDERATPPELFDPLNARFGFTLDACALPRNAKLPRYLTPDDDGLAQSWIGERVWCNPPYSSIEPWVVKAALATSIEGCPLAVMLVPANRTEQRWWQRHVEPTSRPGQRPHRRVHLRPPALHRVGRRRDQAERAPAVRGRAAHLQGPPLMARHTRKPHYPRRTQPMGFRDAELGDRPDAVAAHRELEFLRAAGRRETGRARRRAEKLDGAA